MKLLLADHNRDMLLMYRLLFSGRGDEVVSVFDGAQAAEFLKDGDFDLMIVNRDLPRVRAAQLVRMANEKRIPAVTLVNTTEYEGVETEDLFSAFMLFPFFPEELFAKIEEIGVGRTDDKQIGGETDA